MSTCQATPDNLDGTFGLLGQTLGHSWSPRIHTMLGSAPYALFERAPEEVASFIRKGPWKGLNVTIPYKMVAAELADEVSPRVERLGAANTLVRRPDGTILADNTDVLGFSWMLERFCQRTQGASATSLLEDAPVLVLGSGGASQAVQAALAAHGARISVISRKGEDTYETLLDRHADAALIVNTTPVGMYPTCPASCVSEDVLGSLTHLMGILDVVYNPERTGIVLAAERLQIPSESGLAMLVAQALFSSELFQQRSLDRDMIAEIEDLIRSETRNIVFIGMPGCGKTSAGRKLARLLGRPFVDLDDCFSVDHGLTPSECITRHGEAAFRELETKTAASYASRSGLIIACGGGIVTQPRNYDLLHQNSTIIMLDRPLEELDTEDRPLSQTKGVKRLAAERMDLYRAWADLILPCTGSASGDALLIKEQLHL